MIGGFFGPGTPVASGSEPLSFGYCEHKHTHTHGHKYINRQGHKHTLERDTGTRTHAHTHAHTDKCGHVWNPTQQGRWSAPEQQSIEALHALLLITRHACTRVHTPLPGGGLVRC